MYKSFPCLFLCAVFLSACSSMHDELLVQKDEKKEPIGPGSAILAMLTMGKSEEKVREYEEIEGEEPSFMRKTLLVFQNDEENDDLVLTEEDIRKQQKEYDSVYHPIDAALNVVTFGLYDPRPQLPEDETTSFDENVDDDWLEDELTESHDLEELYDDRTVLDKAVATATLGIVEPNKPEPFIPEGSFTHKEPLVQIKLNQSTLEDVKELLGAPEFVTYHPDGSVEGRFVTRPEKYRDVAIIGESREQKVFFFNTEKILIKVQDYVDPETSYEEIWDD